MFESNLLEPEQFILKLQVFHETREQNKGHLANELSDSIIQKRVDLAAVRLVLLDSGRAALLKTLDRLVDLIEPYIVEGGVEA